MKINDPKTRRSLFYIGVLFITVGSIGILTNSALGNIFNSLFTIFGTTISFAQFSVGFSSLKPDDKSSSPTGSPNTANPGTTPANTLGALHQLARARLISQSGQIDLSDSQFLIGRAQDNQHVLNDAQVSGHHAVIRPEGQGYVLVDRGSRNGTWVDGQRLGTEIPYRLRVGDRIRIGNTTFTYETTGTLAVPPTVVAPKPIAPPPPSYAQPSYTPLPLQPVSVPRGQKRYIGNGIAFIFAGLLSLINAPFALLTPNVSVLLSESVISALLYTFVLCGIHGLYQKQADKAGWLGTVGTLMLAASSMLNVLLSVILIVILALASSGQQILPESLQGFYTLYYINFFFLIFGDIILGISMIRAAVYPRWLSIILIVVGVLDAVDFFAPTMIVIYFIACLLVAALFCGWGITLIQQLPSYPQPPRQ